jgi:hypothetical protein
MTLNFLLYVYAHYYGYYLFDVNTAGLLRGIYLNSKRNFLLLPSGRWRGGEGPRGGISGGGVGLEGAEEEEAVAVAAEVGAAGEEKEPRCGARHGRDLICYACSSGFQRAEKEREEESVAWKEGGREERGGGAT